MRLTSTAPSGTTYRLTATFDVTGPDMFSRVLRTNAMSDTLRLDVPPGSYTLTIRSGWRISVVESGGALTPVSDAVLLQDEDVTVDIVAGVVSPAVYRFGIGPDFIAFGEGRIDVLPDFAEDAGPRSPVLCEEDERVFAGACEPCPPGESNAAGDDPAGPDTFCEDACTLALGLPCYLFEQAYVKASNSELGDRLGDHVALDGDTLVVGAIGEDSNATGVGGSQTDNSELFSGAVYVFTRSGLTWTQQAYIKASNTEENDGFGARVAISGDTLAVAARGEDSNATGIGGSDASNSSASAGAVYVFTRAGSTWTQQAYVKASNTNAGDGFGASVAVDGDTLVVGASGEDSNATGVGGSQLNNSASASGAVYVFTRSAATWTQQAYIKASNTGVDDLFGSSVAIDGDTIAVGARREDSDATGVGGSESSNLASNSGAVYVFTRTGSTWTQEAYVKASNTGAGDAFGASLALDGDTLVVGAAFEDSRATGVGGAEADDSLLASGAAYVFTRTGSTWTQQAYIKASNTDANDGFGGSVAVDGDTLVVTAAGEDSAAVGVDGVQIDGSSTGSGAVYVFTRAGATWTQAAYVKSSNTDPGDLFGISADLSGDTLVVGASGEASRASSVDGDQADNSTSLSGAVYVRRLAP